MSEFARLLRRHREQAGHATTRGFYKSCGGAATFRCSLKQYLNIEKGRCVPRAKLVGALVSLLRLWEAPEKARAFSRAYLDAVIGEEKLLEFLVRSLSPLPTPSGSASTPLRKALARDQESRTKPLSPGQSRLIRKDSVHYWTFRVLLSDSGSWTASGIARVLGLPVSGILRALTNLELNGLVARDKARYSCPHRNLSLKHERPAHGKRYEVAPFMPQLRRHWAGMYRRGGETLFDHYLVLRASESELRNYYPYLAQCVSGGAVYDTVEKGPDTAVIVIEATVKRLMPF